MTKSKFVVMEHKAIRAGKHYDLRFRIPNSKTWISFRITKDKNVPTTSEKATIIRTLDHTEKEALFTGKIEKGEYGAGTLKKYDEGSCNILKYKPKRSITIEFNGRKIRGLYHIISTATFGKQKGPIYLLFKGKEK
jgi:bifunctional non-homologous end joining protein LigD